MCPSGAYLCPEAVAGFGACCESGLACGSGFCYSTSYPTQTLVLTSAFRDGSSNLVTTTATITTAYQPSTVSAIPTTAGPTRMVITETAIPTAIPQIEAVNTTPRTGMSKGTMNGIIAGAVVALALILLGAWLIIRRLNKLARIRQYTDHAGPSPGHKHNLSGDSGNSGLSNVGGEMAAVKDHHSRAEASQSSMPIDPLFMAAGSTAPFSRPSLSHGNSAETDIYGYGTSPPPIPAPYVWNQGYTHVSNNERSYFAQPDQASTHHGSGVGTYSPAEIGRASRVSRDSDLRDQNLRFGHDSNRQSLVSTHGRQWSDASDVSNNSSNPPSELDGRRVSAGDLDSEVGFGPTSGIARRPSAERRSSSWSFMTTGGHRRRSGSGLALNALAFGSSAPLSGGGRLEGVAEAETDATHSTGLLGKAKRKEGRPRAATRGGHSSSATAGGHQGRSASEGITPQIMYTNQAISHSLPAVQYSPPVTRAEPQFSAGPLSPHSSTMHPPLEYSSSDILVTTTTEMSTEAFQGGQYTQGTDESNAGKKKVNVRTREVDPRDP